MRKRLNGMMRHCHVHEILGIDKPEEIWEAGRRLLHATSVVLHAAYKHGQDVQRPVPEIMATALLRKSFERNFLPTLGELQLTLRFIALGATAKSALR